MPLIEDISGESLLIKRLGVEFFDVNGFKYMFDSEPVVNQEYNIAVFFDSFESDCAELNSFQKQHIVYRIYVLAKNKNILLKFFDDNRNEVKPIEDKRYETGQNNISLKKKTVLNLIRLKKYSELFDFITSNKDVLNEKFGYNQESLLHFVSKNGDKEACNLLLELGKDLDEPGKNNETPLVRAAEKGNLDIVEFFIKKGANIDGLNDGIATPLIAAIASGKKAVVNFLLQKGADIERKDKDIDQTPLEVAQNLFREEIVLLLRNFSKETNPQR